jgi:hypothetical protein
MINKTFLTAGKAIFTIEGSEGFKTKYQRSHFTYKVVRDKKYDHGEVFNVFVLTDPDNSNDYTKIGFLILGRGFYHSKYSRFPINHVCVNLFEKAAKRIEANETEEIVKAGFKIHHCNRCARCAKLLTTPTSCENGFGPECVKFICG